MSGISRAGSTRHDGPSSASQPSASSLSSNPLNSTLSPQPQDPRPPQSLPTSRPSSAFLLPSAPPPLHITIRFSTALPDLHLDIPSPHQTTVVALKHLIRGRLAADAEADVSAGKRPDHAPPSPAAQAAVARLRFIQNGRILPDGSVLSAVLRAPPPPPPNQSPDPKGKSPIGSPMRAQRVFINCSIGDALSQAELDAEAVAAAAPPPSASTPSTAGTTPLRPSSVPNLATVNTNHLLNPSPSSAPNGPTTTTAGQPQQSQPRRPQGFDRLSQAGFTPSEIATLRAHFRAIHTARFTPDTMPSPDTLRAMEDAWLDGDSSLSSSAGGGGGGGGGSISSSQPRRIGGPGTGPGGGGWLPLPNPSGPIDQDEDDHERAAVAAAADDAFGLSAVAGPLIQGMLIGFVFPLGVIGWLGKEEGVWSRNTQVFVAIGVLLSLSVGVVRGLTGEG
ncbi:hypothetical protein VTJ04DRAFT_8623 [Mycothermus thermophilus]|uniref:uncharacterized protein n=1 Tax=Humicola insolens TaxID=85995 RepID=UPI003744A440